MALFTGKGDGGTTKAFDSENRIKKDEKLPEALGTVDELNSLLGLCKVCAKNSNFFVNGETSICELIGRIQQDLFTVQAELAGADKSIPDGKVERMEDIINSIEKNLPTITAFSIAGGTDLSALLDYARTVARRAERRMVAVSDERNLSENTRKYMNRLSSLLFSFARLVNAISGIKEESPTYE